MFISFRPKREFPYNLDWMRCYNVLAVIKLLKALFLSMILICLLPDTCFLVMHINI